MYVHQQMGRTPVLVAEAEVTAVDLEAEVTVVDAPEAEMTALAE